MSFTITQIKEHLTGLTHSGTLNKVRNLEAMFERSAAQFLLKCHPIESMRTVALASTIHDDVYNYALASDFGSMIDLIPQDNRDLWDSGYRDRAGRFDLRKALNEKVISIEGSEGSKIARINWKSRQGKVLNTMNSVTGNGTWNAVGSATNVIADTIFKKSGGASIKFNLVASGDGLQNTTMTAIDLTDESQVADVFVWAYFPTVPTSVIAVWGNDLTTKYWTAVSQTTQADGTAFQVGWNLLKFPWSTATQTGAVAPATIDSFKITIASTVTINAIRIDNIVFSIGRNFDMKYYSKYLYKSVTSGLWMSRPINGQDDDLVLVDNDTLPQYLFELLSDAAHQMEGADSTFDIGFAERKLAVLYPAYRGVYPSQVKKQTGSYGSRKPARGRW